MLLVFVHEANKENCLAYCDSWIPLVKREVKIFGLAMSGRRCPLGFSPFICIRNRTLSKGLVRYPNRRWIATSTPLLLQETFFHCCGRSATQRPRQIVKTFSTSVVPHSEPATAQLDGSPLSGSGVDDLPDNLEKLTVKELKELLAKRSLKTSGLKAELVSRLRKYIDTVSAPPPDRTNSAEEMTKEEVTESISLREVDNQFAGKTAVPVQIDSEFSVQSTESVSEERPITTTEQPSIRQNIPSEAAPDMDTMSTALEGPSIHEMIDHAEPPDSTMSSIPNAKPTADIETSMSVQNIPESPLPECASPEAASLISSTLPSAFTTAETSQPVLTPGLPSELGNEQISIASAESVPSPSPVEVYEPAFTPVPSEVEIPAPSRKRDFNLDRLERLVALAFVSDRVIRVQDLLLDLHHQTTSLAKHNKPTKSAKLPKERTVKSARPPVHPSLTKKTIELEALTQWHPGAVFAAPDITLDQDSTPRTHEKRLERLMDLRARMFAARAFEREIRKGPQRNNYLLDFRDFPNSYLTAFQLKFINILGEYRKDQSPEKTEHSQFESAWNDTLREFAREGGHRFVRKFEKAMREEGPEKTPERTVDEVKRRAWLLRERYIPIDALATFLAPENVGQQKAAESDWFRQREYMLKHRKKIIEDEQTPQPTLEPHIPTGNNHIVSVSGRLESPADVETLSKVGLTDSSTPIQAIPKARIEAPSLFAHLNAKKKSPTQELDARKTNLAQALKSGVNSSANLRLPSKAKQDADTAVPKESKAAQLSTADSPLPDPDARPDPNVPVAKTTDEKPFQKQPSEYVYEETIKELLDLTNGKRKRDKPEDANNSGWNLYAYKIFHLKNMRKTLRLAITNRTRREFLRRAEVDSHVGPFSSDANPICQIFNPMWERLGLMEYISEIKSTHEENEFEVMFKNIDGASAFINRVDEHWLDDRTIGQVHATWKPEGEGNHWENSTKAVLTFPKRTLDIWRMEAVKRGAPIGKDGYPEVQWTRAIWAVVTRMRYSIGSFGDAQSFRVMRETPYRVVADIMFKDSEALQQFLRRKSEHHISNEWKDRFFAREWWKFGY